MPIIISQNPRWDFHVLFYPTVCPKKICISSHFSD